ncbi:hydantoinase B/oxoprolinase family protein [Nonomuraea thailandensis]
MTTDPLTAEVLRNALVVAAEEAGIVVVRSAYSTFIVEGSDASAAVLDARGRLIAHSMATTLMNSMALKLALPELLKDIPRRPCAPARCTRSTTPTAAACTPTTCWSTAPSSSGALPPTSPPP